MRGRGVAVAVTETLQRGGERQAVEIDPAAARLKLFDEPPQRRQIIAHDRIRWGGNWTRASPARRKMRLSKSLGGPCSKAAAMALHGRDLAARDASARKKAIADRIGRGQIGALAWAELLHQRGIRAATQDIHLDQNRAGMRSRASATSRA